MQSGFGCQILHVWVQFFMDALNMSSPQWKPMCRYVDTLNVQVPRARARPHTKFCTVLFSKRGSVLPVVTISA